MLLNSSSLVSVRARHMVMSLSMALRIVANTSKPSIKPYILASSQGETFVDHASQKVILFCVHHTLHLVCLTFRYQYIPSIVTMRLKKQRENAIDI